MPSGTRLDCIRLDFISRGCFIYYFLYFLYLIMFVNFLSVTSSLWSVFLLYQVGLWMIFHRSIKFYVQRNHCVHCDCKLWFDHPSPVVLSFCINLTCGCFEDEHNADSPFRCKKSTFVSLYSLYFHSKCWFKPRRTSRYEEVVRFVVFTFRSTHTLSKKIVHCITRANPSYSTTLNIYSINSPNDERENNTFLWSWVDFQNRDIWKKIYMKHSEQWDYTRLHFIDFFHPLLNAMIPPVKIYLPTEARIWFITNRVNWAPDCQNIHDR